MSTTTGSDLADLALVHSLGAEIRALASAVDRAPLDPDAGEQLCTVLRSPRAVRARVARRRLLEEQPGDRSMGEGVCDALVEAEADEEFEGS